MEHVIKGYHDEALKHGHSLPPDFKNFIFGLLARDREEREAEDDNPVATPMRRKRKIIFSGADPLSAKLERLREIHGVVTIILDEDGMSIYGRKHKMGCDFCNKDYALAVDAALEECDED